MDIIKKLTIGLIGSGMYARVHANAYRSDSRTVLKVLWSPTKSHREEAASELGCTAAETWQEIINDSSIDCISVSTPDFAHTEYAVAALNAGKHVLLEKPMAMTSSDCEKIIAARDRSGKNLMVNYHNRWYPAFKTAREAISSGKIGKPVCCNFVLSNTISWVEGNMTWADKSGPEWFLMPHIVDLALWVLKDKPVEIFSMMREGLLKSKGFMTRDLVKATMKLESGTIADFESSWVLAKNWRNPVNDMWASIQGESGRVDIVADFESYTITSSENYQTPFLLNYLTQDPPIHDFITCIIDNKESPVTGEEGLLVTKSIEAVIKSYIEKRIVYFDEIE